MLKQDLETGSDRPAYRRIGIYMPLLIIIGIAMTMLVYVASMRVLGWQIPTLNHNNNLGFMSTGSVFSNKDITLYASPNTTQYFSSIGGNYERLLTPWRGYFSNRHINITDTNDPIALHHLAKGLLILPSSVALSDDERNSIRNFQAEGGAVLATWASGTRNEKNEWVGWDFVESLGAKLKGEMPSESIAHYLVLNGESPLSFTHPAGTRIWLGNVAERPLRFQGSNLAGRMMDWSRTPQTEQQDEGAVLYTETSPTKGRTAVFSFAESAWESQPQPIYKLVDDTLSWLQRQPNIVRSAWPNGKRAAEIIEMDTEQDFPNALRFASMMHTIDYRGSFYILTSIGKQFPDVLLTLARDFEIGYHGDIHVGFKGQPAAEQLKRINTMLAEMASVLPNRSNLTGFRAPTEDYDNLTEKILLQHGIRHHVADPSSTEARLPVFAKIDGIKPINSLVVLPRTQRDDINLAKENLTVEQTTQALIDDFDLTENMGALGVLSVHSQNYANTSVLTQAMPNFLTHLKQHREHLWLASPSQIADWWRERERFKLSTKMTGKRVEFDISITGEASLNGASLTVMLPEKGVLPSVTGTKIGMPTATVAKIDDYRVSITFDTLSPGNYAYQLTFD